MWEVVTDRSANGAGELADLLRARPGARRKAYGPIAHSRVESCIFAHAGECGDAVPQLP